MKRSRFDVFKENANRPHSERFEELMKRTERVNEYYYFTDEEIEFLGKEDLGEFGKKFPNEAEKYMSW